MKASVLVLLCSVACAQTAYTLHGKVTVPATLTALEFWEPQEILATVRTGDDGSFTVDVPADRWEPHGPVFLCTRAPGYATGLVRAGLADAPVEIRLRKGKTVTGWVRAPSGAPIRGARVRYGSGWHHPALDLESSETDANGRFRLEGIDPARPYLYVTHPAFQPAWPDAREAGALDVVLQPLKEVRGRVLADGRPVRGARLCIRDPEDPFYVTGADGKYRAWCLWDNVDDRVYHFRVVASGYWIQECLYDGEDIHLDQCAPLTGRVVDPDGAPVARTTVTCRGVGVEQRCETDRDGRFRFDAVPAVSTLYDYELRVEKNGFIRIRHEFELTDPPQHMTLRLARGARFVGRVVRDGKPVPGAGISATGDPWLARASLTGRDVVRNAYADRDGRFVLDAVPDDADGVYAWRSKDWPHREYRSLARPVAAEEGGSYDLGDLELRDRLPLRGRVTDHEGRPVVGLKLICRPGVFLADSCYERTTSTDGTGRFEFPRLPVGDWNLLAGPEEHLLIGDLVYPGDILEYQLDPPD